MTSVTDLPATGLAGQVQCLHLKVNSCWLQSATHITTSLQCPKGNNRHRRLDLCQHLRNIQRRGLCRGFWSTSSSGLDISNLALSMWNWSTFPSMINLKTINFILYKTLGKRIPELLLTVGGSGAKLSKLPHSQWILHYDCNQHAHASDIFTHDWCMRYTNHSTRPGLQSAYQITPSNAFSR